MSRDEMIALLVNDTVERMVVLRQVFWLQEILEDGFSGYAQLSDEGLRRELSARGLDLVSPADELVDSDFYDLENNDDFLRHAGHLGSNSPLQYLQD